MALSSHSHGHDFSIHLPTTRNVDKTNGHRQGLSLGLFHYLHHPHTPVRTKTIEEVADEAHRRAFRIFGYYDTLHAILLEHENTLRIRWIKKTREQRKKLLLTAWPKMAESYRPDMQAIARESIEQRREGTNYRTEFMFPYINLEDLLKAKNLLLFFQSRGHSLPDNFAHHDLMTTLLGRGSTAIHPLYIDGYTMFFCGMLVPEGYGMCASWDEAPFESTDDDAFELMWDGIGWQPGDGLLILEIQENIMSFLVQCAELILHDLLPLKVPPTKTSIFTEPPMPESLSLSPMKPIPSDGNWGSVAAAAAEAPYRVPVQFDFEYLQRLVDARRAEAEDDLWTLREDPGFFQDTVKELSEHRQEVLRNKNGKPHPSYDTPEYWTRMFRYIVQSAYQKLAMWDTIQKSLKRLATLGQLHRVEGIRITPLPLDYAEELSHFWYLIKNVRPILLSNFHGIVASPPLRDYYLRVYHENPKAILYRRKDDSRAGSFLCHFLWLVEQFQQPDQLELSGIYNILDEFERLSRNAPSLGGPSENLISPFIASAISELAVVGELQRQLDWHQPRIFPNIVSEQKLKSEYNKRTTLMSIFDRVEADLYDIGMPLMKMKYPIEKRKTPATVQRMREAESALDTFWQAVDDFYKGKTSKTLHDLCSDLLTPRQLRRTPPWVEPPSLSPSPRETKDNLDFVLEPFSSGFIEPSRQVIVDALPKTKVKTRGDPSTNKDAYSPNIR